MDFKCLYIHPVNSRLAGGSPTNKVLIDRRSGCSDERIVSFSDLEQIVNSIRDPLFNKKALLDIFRFTNGSHCYLPLANFSGDMKNILSVLFQLVDLVGQQQDFINKQLEKTCDMLRNSELKKIADEKRSLEEKFEREKKLFVERCNLLETLVAKVEKSKLLDAELDKITSERSALYDDISSIKHSLDSHGCCDDNLLLSEGDCGSFVSKSCSSVVKSDNSFGAESLSGAEENHMYGSLDNIILSDELDEDACSSISDVEEVPF